MKLKRFALTELEPISFLLIILILKSSQPPWAKRFATGTLRRHTLLVQDLPLWERQLPASQDALSGYIGRR